MGSLNNLYPHERGAVHHLQEVLRDWLGTDLVKVIFFGKRIKRKCAEGEEIDVLVVIREVNQTKINRVTNIFFDVNVEDNVKFIPMVYDETEFADPVHRESPFIKKILEDAVEITD